MRTSCTFSESNNVRILPASQFDLFFDVFLESRPLLNKEFLNQRLKRLVVLNEVLQRGCKLFQRRIVPSVEQQQRPEISDKTQAVAVLPKTRRKEELLKRRHDLLNVTSNLSLARFDHLDRGCNYSFVRDKPPRTDFLIASFLFEVQELRPC